MGRQQEDDATLITLSDILRICKKAKYKILCGTLFFAFLGTVFSLTQSIKYRADATFREKSKNVMDSAGAGRNAALSLLLGASDSNENAAISLLKSRRLMSELIKKMGLQAEISPRGIQFKRIKRIRDNLKAGWADFIDSKTPALPDIVHDIQVREIEYPCEVPLYLIVTIEGDNMYTLFDESWNTLGRGKFGEPFRHGNCSFVLLKVQGKGLEGNSYHLNFQPLPPLADELSKEIKAYSDGMDKTLIRLSWDHRDRHHAANLLNTLMETYQEYLQEEQQRITSNQVSYLNSRRDEMAGHLRKQMEDHAQLMAENMGSLELLAENLQVNNQKLIAIDLEIKRLQQTKQEGTAYYDRQNTEGDPAVINSILNEIRSLQQQSDSIKIALEGKNFSKTNVDLQGIDLATANQIYLNYSMKVDDLDADILQHTFLLEKMQEPEIELSSLTTVLRDPVSEEIITKASLLALNLKDQHNRSQKELERISQDLALQKRFLIEHIKHSVNLLRQRSRSYRKKIWDLQRTILDLVQQRITILEAHLQSYLDSRLINLKQEQAVIRQHQEEIRNKMQGMHGQWASEKLIDQHLEMDKKIIGQIVQLIEEKNISDNLDLSQSAPVDKSIPPIHPLQPMILIFAFLGGAFGALFTLSIVFFKEMVGGVEATEENLALARIHTCGKISKEYLKTDKGALLDNDLATLRRIVSWITTNCKGAQKTTRGSPILLIRGDGPDFSLPLAELLSKTSSKVLLLPLHFDQPSTPGKTGLLQVLEGKADQPDIQKMKEVDTIASGGISRYAIELISSQKFQDFLNRELDNYDWVIAVSDAMPASSQAEYLMSLFDNAIVNLSGERLPELKRLIDICKDPESKKKMTFVFPQDEVLTQIAAKS